MARYNTVKEERKFLRECIELYRDLPALWQLKNKLYYDRDEKNMAYNILLAKYNKMFPQATKEDLKKKINSLRTNYRKELKKCVNSIKSRASTKSSYVSTLWYFQEMSFLRDQELPLDSESSMDTYKIAAAVEDKDIEEQRSETPSFIDEIRDSRTCQTPSHTTERACKKTKKSKRPLNFAYERISEVKDEYYHWSIACAADLRKMERTQRIYAKKAIAEIIMEGQLGLLHRHSVKINGNTLLNSAEKFGTWDSYCNQMPSPSYSNHTPTSPSHSNPSPSHPLPEYISSSCVKSIAESAAVTPDISVNPVPNKLKTKMQKSSLSERMISEPAPAKVLKKAG